MKTIKINLLHNFDFLARIAQESKNNSESDQLTSYLPRLFKKDMLTDPIGFLKNHLPEPRELEW